jgi:hypothetical protein
VPLPSPDTGLVHRVGDRRRSRSEVVTRGDLPRRADNIYTGTSVRCADMSPPHALVALWDPTLLDAAGIERW